MAQRKSVEVHASVNYHENGDITIRPEKKKPMESRIEQGRVITESDGTSHFRAYRRTEKKNYEIIFQTTNGVVKTTRSEKHPERKKIIVKVSLPYSIGKDRYCEEFARQIGNMLDYLFEL